jgi:hypothetical protein
LKTARIIERFAPVAVALLAFLMLLVITANDVRRTRQGKTLITANSLLRPIVQRLAA